ncbi:hypothetical protein ACQJ21_21180 [Klebsiella michiganensis]|uniref:hypothetical protein n=1 Tax=Klebsiella michiganensis TaxID=1134687 RepID=UPI003D024DEE
MANEKNLTVWQKNGIPPLAYCSLERASKLLDCEISDFYSWMNHLNPCIELGRSSVEVLLQVTLTDGDNPYKKGDISREYISLAASSTSGRLTPTSPVIDTNATDDVNTKELVFNAYFEGMASIIFGLNISYDNELYILPDELFCGLLIKKTSLLHTGPEKNIMSLDDVTFGPIPGYAYDAPPILLSKEDIYFSREDVELIYDCGIKGIDFPEGKLNMSEHMKSKPKVRETAKQSRFIAYLMNVAGISEEELRTHSINGIMNRLSHKAVEMNFPDVTDDSLSSWLEKAGYR